MGSSSSLISNPSILRFGAWAARSFFPRLSFRNTAIFSGWQDVQDILHRDLDFLIAPVNGERIERVNGPFILGMDRSETHLAERQALYAAMHQIDWPRLQNLAAGEADEVLEDMVSGEIVNVVGGYARPIAAKSAAALMGIKGPNIQDRMRVARALFHECFLNLNDDPKVRETAVAAFEELKAWCDEEIAGRRKQNDPGHDMIGRLIMDGKLDDDAIRRTVSGMFVGSIDTTATCVAQIMTVILKRPDVKREVLKDLHDIQRMRGWCYEALRFWPHNPIIMREAANDTTVGGKTVKAGTRVICFTLAAMHDPGVFGLPGHFDPQRPLENYLHFGGGLHPCAGRAVNGVQIPVLVAKLLARDPVIQEKIKFEGPFPNSLVLKLQK